MRAEPVPQFAISLHQLLRVEFGQRQGGAGYGLGPSGGELWQSERVGEIRDGADSNKT